MGNKLPTLLLDKNPIQRKAIKCYRSALHRMIRAQQVPSPTYQTFGGLRRM